MVGGGWGCPQAYAEVVARLSLDGLLVTSLSYKGIGPQHTGVCVCVWGVFVPLCLWVAGSVMSLFPPCVGKSF